MKAKSGSNRRRTGTAVVLAAMLGMASASAHADAVTEWNAKACDFVAEARIGPPAAARVIAITQTAVFEAANAVSKRYAPGKPGLDAAPGASLDAAVLGAYATALSKLLPTQQAAVDAAYRAALAAVPDSPARAAGIAVGERAAAAILALRADDGASASESYRPLVAPGVYSPTVIPAVSTWVQRKPWLMTAPAQFRPGPPPALTSAVWARDYNEIKVLGARTNSKRSSEQTDIARFWEATLPSIYHGVLRSVAEQSGRDLTQNARFFAAAAQAGDDALIAVFDAKYHYNFWRPLTAIRNGDQDGNDATERDPSWLPLIETPMHPEYPCAHCTVAGAIGTVLRAEIGKSAPKISTTSYLVKGSQRSWTNVDDFVQEVSLARIYDGVHYRTSTEVGTALGKQVGALAVAKFWGPNQ